MNIIPIKTRRFVKNEDLNHHGTLFAGRAAEWFVETGLIAAATCVPVENVVCLNIHGMTFIRPVNLGEIVELTGKIVLAGRTSLIANVCMYVGDIDIMDGFITFVNVGRDGHPSPHGIGIQAISTEDITLQERAKSLRP
jgi:Acyl-CoA hydrolase